MVSRPEVVKLYNKAMGGVDLLNKLVSLYGTEIQSKKWTLKMITHAFDVAVVNSWLEYRLVAKRANIQTKDILDLLHFKMNVAQCLVRVLKTVAAKRGRPKVVKLYNKAMGGVDLLNKLVSLYGTEIQSKKWTLKMITHAFDVAVVNSWLEYRLVAKRANIQTKDILDLLHFKMNVAQCLVRVLKTVAAKRGRPSMSPEPQLVPQRPAHRQVQDVRPLPEV
ncbi:piggyBac transposable element-derived protein 3-like [Scomber scombrus]|uniref:PiggyBac transposable element-derived protein 3-like n=1 Tax=Scomber scombrus TaxID=13677 RepID=A0AAV1PF61_SCOSC